MLSSHLSLCLPGFYRKNFYLRFLFPYNARPCASEPRDEGMWEVGRKSSTNFKL